MQIEKIAAQVRPRNGWEAVDLGFVMARHWFFKLWCIWLITALPVFAIVHLIFIDTLWLALLLVWWLKPLYEQAQLYFLSRALFNEHVSSREIVRNIFKIVSPQLFQALTWRRFSFNRAFNNPVVMLEGLRSKERSKRLGVLHYRQNSSAWLTIIGVHFEAILNISILSLIIMFVPEQLEWLSLSDIFSNEGESYYIIEWLWNSTYFIAISLIAPFYIAGGFALYLTRRTELEGWDIEINFKRLMNRLNAGSKHNISSIIGILLVGMILVLPVNNVQAESVTDTLKLSTISPEQAKQSIQEILKKEEFGKTIKVKRWKYIGKPDESDDTDWSWLEEYFKGLSKSMEIIANFLEVLAWVGVAILVVLLIMKLTGSAKWFSFKSEKSITKPQVIPTTLFGLDMKADSLPEDIIQVVLNLLNDKRIREALSLLYRASLIKLMHTHQLEIPPSATEEECQILVVQSRPALEVKFFSQLTHVWILTAYAHQFPENKLIEDLCRQWQANYEVSA